MRALVVVCYGPELAAWVVPGLQKYAFAPDYWMQLSHSLRKLRYVKDFSSELEKKLWPLEVWTLGFCFRFASESSAMSSSTFGARALNMLRCCKAHFISSDPLVQEACVLGVFCSAVFQMLSIEGKLFLYQEQPLV